eukprot:874277-Amphidinium_carterae.1
MWSGARVECGSRVFEPLLHVKWCEVSHLSKPAMRPSVTLLHSVHGGSFVASNPRKSANMA